MNKELFGVFGDITDFEAFRLEQEFDSIIKSEQITVGIRDPGLSIPGRSASYSNNQGSCMIWGEVYPQDRIHSNAARWLLEQYVEKGNSAIENLNGSYIAIIQYSGDAIVFMDPIRSWECFYTNCDGIRVFGSDAGRVAKAIKSPTDNKQSIREFLHLGVILGDKTLFNELRRVPFDGFLTSNKVGKLRRFVYNTRNFDYEKSLANRLKHAIQLRSNQPGKKGVLLSAGYDSRTILSQLPEIEHCYTIGKPNVSEVQASRKISTQYNANHTTFTTNEKYILPDEQKVRYMQGIKESIHAHHTGYTENINVDTMYHALLFDTILKEFPHKNAEMQILGKTVPLKRLEENIDPAEASLNNFGYHPEQSQRLSEKLAEHSTTGNEFVQQAIETEFEHCWERTDSIQNALALFSISNQPTIPSRTHLADNFFESFIAADKGLLEWHLQTPPKYRCSETFVRAMKLIDGELLRHRPPDRPFSSTLLSEVVQFARRQLPYIDSVEPPWPDLHSVYDQYDIDKRLSFKDKTELKEISPKHKLRANDIIAWSFQCADSPVGVLN
ncbi:hypothetical protein ACFFQF_23885 [Haladaptatus pallidirubidus]|nr:hypothetical protein [Haladaptatus pallidirubidus]